MALTGEWGDAAAALARGELVVIPTDTVYGVAAAPHAPSAIERLFVAKGRPANKAIPVLGAGVDELAEVARFDAAARAAAERWWPGPLTLVLPRAAAFAADLGGKDRATVAVRVPDHPELLALLRATGPLAVTSANRTGDPPAGTVGAARAALGDAVAVYVDGGPVAGAASTVARWDEGRWTVLRPGPIDVE